LDRYKYRYSPQDFGIEIGNIGRSYWQYQVSFRLYRVISQYQNKAKLSESGNIQILVCGSSVSSNISNLGMWVLLLQNKWLSNLNFIWIF